MVNLNIGNFICKVGFVRFVLGVGVVWVGSFGFFIIVVYVG